MQKILANFLRITGAALILVGMVAAYYGPADFITHGPLIPAGEERLRSRGYPGLEVLTHVFEGEGHSSAYAASVSRAIWTLHNQDWLNDSRAHKFSLNL